MLERSFLLPIAKKSDWKLSNIFYKENITNEELKELLINIIEGLYNNIDINLDDFVLNTLKRELNLEEQSLLLEILLLTTNFLQKWYTKLKEKKILERHNLKIKSNYIFKNLVTETCLEKITTNYFSDSLLKYCFFITRNIEYKKSDSDLEWFIKYVFLQNVLIDWSEKIKSKRKTVKPVKIDFSVLETKKEKEICEFDTVLHLEIFYLQDINLTDFFVKALQYEKDAEKILVNLKSHEVLINFVHKIKDINLIQQTYSHNEKSTFNLFKKINDEELLKKFIIKNNGIFLSELLFKQCNKFDDLFVEALLVCETKIHSPFKLLNELINSSYFQLFLKKTNTFENICICLSNTNLNYELILSNINFDDLFLEKLILFRNYFKKSTTFSVKFTDFLQNYFKNKPFKINTNIFYKLIFDLRKENFLIQFYKEIIFVDTDLFLNILFKNEIFDLFFVETLMLICNLCDELITEKVKLLINSTKFTCNYWHTVIKKYLTLLYYRRYGIFYENSFKNSVLEFKNKLFLDQSEKHIKEYPVGLAFKDSLLTIKTKSDFVIYLVINSFSVYNSNFITFKGESDFVFEILNEKIVLKNNGGYFMFPQDKSGTKKLISFEKKGNFLKIQTGKFARSFPTKSIFKIELGNLFEGIVERILFLENTSFSKNIFTHFCTDKFTFYEEIIKKLEKKLSYYNKGGVYIDSLKPYYINKGELEIEFINVLYNDNFSLAEEIRN
ncbi:hypothetical protein TUBRATIS_006340 [Tubulinosema ratisbonensis]|uniref:Uncharacterized protein n=1 Tax=Tubulinosema ratisbonensis TaxID=291195 RepID=A0A437ANR8_9MICR|nr:hypothetical protein TUBRATIS_006340 [Tubulinosema ratisbonensis]